MKKIFVSLLLITSFFASAQPRWLGFPNATFKIPRLNIDSALVLPDTIKSAPNGSLGKAGSSLYIKNVNWVPVSSANDGGGGLAYQASMLDIFSGNSDQTAKINAAYALPHINEIIFDDAFGYTILGTVTVPPTKKATFKNASYLKGTGSFVGGLVECDFRKQCFASTLSSVTGIESNVISVGWFGIVSNSSTDNWPAFNRAIQAGKEYFTGTGGYKQGNNVYIPSNNNTSYYYLAQTLYINRGINFFSDGATLTDLRFPASTYGIIVYSNWPTQNTAYYPKLYGFRIAGVGQTNQYKWAGLWIQTKTVVDDMWIERWNGDGIYVSGVAPQSNANHSRIHNVKVGYNTRHGIVTIGADANQLTIDGLEATGNGEYGIFENSFLGNSYTSPSTASNGHDIWQYSRAIAYHVGANDTGYTYKARQPMVQRVSRYNRRYQCILPHLNEGGAKAPGGLLRADGSPVKHWNAQLQDSVVTDTSTYKTYWVNVSSGGVDNQYFLDYEEMGNTAFVPSAVKPTVNPVWNGITYQWSDYWHSMGYVNARWGQVNGVGGVLNWDSTKNYLGCGSIVSPNANNASTFDKVYKEDDDLPALLGPRNFLEFGFGSITGGDNKISKGNVIDNMGRTTGFETYRFQTKPTNVYGFFKTAHNLKPKIGFNWDGPQLGMGADSAGLYFNYSSVNEYPLYIQRDGKKPPTIYGTTVDRAGIYNSYSNVHFLEEVYFPLMDAAGFATGTRSLFYTPGIKPGWGYHEKGEIAFNANSNGSDTLYWICTAAGTPGTWTFVKPGTGTGGGGSSTTYATPPIDSVLAAGHIASAGRAMTLNGTFTNNEASIFQKNIYLNASLLMTGNGNVVENQTYPLYVRSSNNGSNTNPNNLVYIGDNGGKVSIGMGSNNGSTLQVNGKAYADSLQTLNGVGTNGRIMIFTNDGKVRPWKDTASLGSGSVNTTPQALTYGATTTWNYTNGQIATLTLTGNSTLSMSNVPDGASGQLLLSQDATGGRSLTLPTPSVFLGKINTTASGKTLLGFTNYGGTAYWYVVDKELGDISKLTPNDSAFLSWRSGAWTSRTIAQVKADLGISGNGTVDLAANYNWTGKHTWTNALAHIINNTDATGTTEAFAVQQSGVNRFRVTNESKVIIGPDTEKVAIQPTNLFVTSPSGSSSDFAFHTQGSWSFINRPSGIVTTMKLTSDNQVEIPKLGNSTPVTTGNTRNVIADANGRLSVAYDIFNVVTGTTSNATPTTLNTVSTISASSAGTITLEMTGINAGDGTAITGEIKLRFSKSSGGTITLGAITTVLAKEKDSGMSSTDFTVTSSSGNILVTATGLAATNIQWKGILKINYAAVSL
jgi:hypothetical protein